MVANQGGEAEMAVRFLCFCGEKIKGNGASVCCGIPDLGIKIWNAWFSCGI
jgi:hypothetical protein